MDAADLLRASVTDADAVAQYLERIDMDELRRLLDQFAHSTQTKQLTQFQTQDWLALVQLLLRCDVSRLLTVKRIVQTLWRSNTSESERAHWITEVSLGYLSVLDACSHSGDNKTSAVQSELRLLVDLLLQFLADTLSDDGDTTAIPATLSLLMLFLGVHVELNRAATSDGVGHVTEVLSRVFTLRWSAKTMSMLLEPLRESAAIVPATTWDGLRHKIHNVLGHQHHGRTQDKSTQLFREVMVTACTTHSVDWMLLARSILCALPARARAEAEFYLQMNLQQTPQAVRVVCEASRHSIGSTPRSSRTAASDLVDVVALLHAIHASRPILSYQSTTARFAVESNVFGELETVLWRIFEQQLMEGSDKVSEMAAAALTFGGQQVHHREWKALLLMDVAFHWLRTARTTQNALGQSVASTDASHSRKALAGRSLLHTVFQRAPEAHAELLRAILEGTKDVNRPTREAYALAARELLERHARTVVAHLALIQDWMTLIFQTHQELAERYLTFTLPILRVSRDLFHFMMVFLRKLLSSTRRDEQQFAVNTWLLWLSQDDLLDGQQEEEVVAAVSSCVSSGTLLAVYTVTRIAALFQKAVRECAQPLHLRPSSWSELCRVLHVELSKVVDDVVDDGSSDEDDEGDNVLFERLDSLSLRFTVDSRPDTRSLVTSDSAAMLEAVLLCVFAIQDASPALAEPETLAQWSDTWSRLRRWVAWFVSDSKLLFHWIARGHSRPSGTAITGASKTGSQKISQSIASVCATRTALATALCVVALELTLSADQARDHQIGSERPTLPQLSMWTLIEVFFCLQKLGQSLHASSRAEDQAGFQALVHRFTSVARKHASQVLEIVTQRVAGDSDAVFSREDLPSLPSLLYVLDCVADRSDRYDNSNMGTDARRCLVHQLTRLYRVLIQAVRNQLTHTERSDRMAVVFAHYSDTIRKRIPKSLRHLVDASGEVDSVTLDVKAAGACLTKVCDALARLVGDLAPDGAIDDAVALMLLQDLQVLMSCETIAKYRVACVLLVKKLHDVTTTDRGEQRWQLASCAYEILCDNIVHQPVLLRELLRLALLVAPSTGRDAKATLDRVVGTLEAAGFAVHRRRNESRADDAAAPKKRKRLRRARPEPTDASSDSEGETSTKRAAQPHLSEPAAQAMASLTLLQHVDHIQTQMLRTISTSTSTSGSDNQVVGLHERQLLIINSLLWGRDDLEWMTAKVLVKLIGALDACVRVTRHCLAAMKKLLSSSFVHADMDAVATALAIVLEQGVDTVMSCRDWATMVQEGAGDVGTKTKLATLILKLDAFVLDAPTPLATISKQLSTTLPDISERLRQLQLRLADAIAARGATAHGQFNKAKKQHLVGYVPVVKARRKRLRSRHPYIDDCLRDEDGDDAFADLEDFIA